MINAFFNKNRLKRCEAKHDPRRAPAREHGDGDLGWKVSAVCPTLDRRVTYLFSLRENVCTLVFQAAFLRPGYPRSEVGGHRS